MRVVGNLDVILDVLKSNVFEDEDDGRSRLPKVGKESQALFAVPRRAQFFQPLGSVICEFFPAKIRGLQRPRWPAS